MTYDEFLANPIYSKMCNVIYKFKNKLNGKIYIGLTITPVRKRVIEHITTSKPWTKAKKGYFQRALYNYGFENFEFEIIEQCENKEDLDIREIYWIGYYKSDQKEFGYNLTPGGKGNTNKEFNRICVERLRKANTGSKRSDDTKKLMSERAKTRMSNKKYKEDVFKRLPEMWEKNRVKVILLDLNYNPIKIYNSVREASLKIYGKRKSTLSRNLHYKDNLYKGFLKDGYLYMLYDKYKEFYL